MSETNWWAERWQRYVLSEAQRWTPPETKLRSARKAEVELKVERGRVKAEVSTASLYNTYTATLKVKPLGDREWKRVIDEIAANPAVGQRFLAGNLGAELEQIFAAAGAALFPAPSAQRPVKCTCTEQWGCRHINVLAVHGGQMFAANPFLWLEALGRPRADLLAAVRSRLADLAGDPAVPAASAQVSGNFWETEVNPDTIPVRPGSAPTPDALLRLLGPLPLAEEAATVELLVEREVERGGRTFQTTGYEDHRADELLRRYAVRIGRTAAELARGEVAPAYGATPLPGKAAPLAERLAAEVEEAVAREGGVLDLGQLFRTCPTAAALPWSQAWPALRTALLHLPPEMTSLLGTYAGRRADFLEGLCFRHVISFGEWRTGRLSAEADWVQALVGQLRLPAVAVRAAGRVYMVPEPDGEPSGLLAALGAQVGDELVLTVEDPAQALFAATLRRRAGLGTPSLSASNEPVIKVLVDYVERSQTWHRYIAYAEAIGVMLAAGAYRLSASPAPVWLLGELGGPLYAQGRSRQLTTERWYAASKLDFVGPRYGRRHDVSDAMARFGAVLAQSGLDLKAADKTLAVVRAWSTYYPLRQDDPGDPPPLAALLNFLWVMMPPEVGHRMPYAERAPEHLATWFTWLSNGKPKLRAAFQPHLAACGLMDAYLHRVQTLPGRRTSDAALLPWRLEGYRWIGAELVLGDHSATM